MNTFRSGSRVPARRAAARICSRNGVAPAMWVQRSDCINCDRGVGVPAIHQHGGGAEQQRAFEGVDRAADVRDRRGHQERVAGLDQPVLSRSAGSGRGSNYGCAERLWGAGGARGVEDHPHGVRVERRQVTAAGGGVEQRRRTACGRPVSPRTTTTSGGAVELSRSPGPASPRSRGRRTSRDEDHPAVGVGEDERSSRSRSDGRIGFTTMPASVAAEVDDRGLVPIGQHERHHAARRHPRGQWLRPAPSRWSCSSGSQSECRRRPTRCVGVSVARRPAARRRGWSCTHRPRP